MTRTPVCLHASSGGEVGGADKVGAAIFVKDFPVRLPLVARGSFYGEINMYI